MTKKNNKQTQNVTNTRLHNVWTEDEVKRVNVTLEYNTFIWVRIKKSPFTG